MAPFFLLPEYMLIYICQHMGASYSQRRAVPLMNLSFSLPAKDSPQPLIILFHSQLCKSYLFGPLLTYCVTVNVIQTFQIGLHNWSFPRFSFSSYNWFLFLSVGNGFTAETLLPRGLPRHPVSLSLLIICSYYNWIFPLHEL